MSLHERQVRELIDHVDLWENYFRNTIIPQMYVDAELRLRKFTPPAMKQFRLAESDLGKSINDLQDNFRFHSIVDNIQYVIDNNEVLEKEIQTSDQRWYQMNILPFISLKNQKSDGAIITFIEITARIKDLKIQEKRIAENALLLDTLSHDLKNPLANAISAMALCKTVSPDNKEE